MQQLEFREHKLSAEGFESLVCAFCCAGGAVDGWIKDRIAP